MKLYILQMQVLIPEKSIEHWGGCRQIGKIIRRAEYGDITISTVFLGIDHGFNPNEPPVLFETMVFGGVHDSFLVRYKTYREAYYGHIDIARELGYIE